MFNFVGNILEAAVKTVTLPIAVVADVVTLGDNSYTEDTFDRYEVVAKTVKDAIRLTKIAYGLSEFREDKHLKVDINSNETKSLEQYNAETGERLPARNGIH